ncbi:MAG: sigma-70 family RNA polymerase sigma factor [Thermoguttaceae bacterium]
MIRAMSPLEPYLAEHQFQELFIEALGWDRAAGSLELLVDRERFRLSIIAQKRGLQVLHAPTENLTLIDRGLLRRIQRKLARLIHEHLVIYSCESPRKQVWQWAVRLGDGQRLRHREHPFFSSSPPPGLVARLEQLRFNLVEEEQVTLMDALGRVREVLDAPAEMGLFVHRPWFAKRSDELAQALEAGGEAELHEFVEFHRPLVRWAVRPLVGLYGGSLEDAEQSGTIGLLYAARHYQRSRGFQFSTYAVRCIQGYCRRQAPLWFAPIRIPDHVIWRCFKLQRVLERVAAEGGPCAVAEYLEELAVRQPLLAEKWKQFERAVHFQSLSERSGKVAREAHRLPVKTADYETTLVEDERNRFVRETVAGLRPRDTAFVHLRYGFDGSDHTLERIGQQFGVTRERVRQRLAVVEKKLGYLLKPAAEQASNGNGRAR